MECAGIREHLKIVVRYRAERGQLLNGSFFGRERSDCCFREYHLRRCEDSVPFAVACRNAASRSVDDKHALRCGAFGDVIVLF